MKILIIEDDDKKRLSIQQHLLAQNVSADDILHAATVAEFAALVNRDIDLFIIDIRIPSIYDGVPSQNGKTVIETLLKAGKGDALLLAISSFPEDFTELRPFFEKHGCILSDFRDPASWKSTLNHLLIQRNKTLRFDFIIFCALEEERSPYIALFPGGKNIIRGGIDCYDIKIGNKKGTVAMLPKMGLVNAAITAGICIDRYRPSIVGMSGICGGFKARAKLGQLLISEMVYEYQSGKWTSDGFSQEPYQVSADHSTITMLRPIINQEGLVAELEIGFKGKRPSDQYQPSAGIFTSGSAVIADEKFLNQIGQVHRKVAGLDMEIFAIQRAGEISVSRPVCICAKTVVDLCDDDKNDKIHAYGSYISAKFIIKAISALDPKIGA